MYEISEKFKTWWRKYDDVEKCRLIKEKAIEVNNNHKKMVRAFSAECNYTGYRTGVRGGKITKLYANSQTATNFYIRSAGELKYMVATL